MRILYNSKDTEFKKPFGTLAPGELCVMHIGIPRSLCTQFVRLVVEDPYGRVVSKFAFAWDCEEDGYDVFKCDFSLQQRGLYFYWFQVCGRTGDFRLFKQGYDTNMEAGDKWQLSVIPRERMAPEGFMGQVMYQIFPDRFRRKGSCDTSEKLQPFTLREDWGGQPEFRPNEKGQVLCNDFFGGSFAGITEKLDYLKSFGVSVIYLNPISMAFSNHRYDTADYKRPDPMLGTEADFKALCDKAHSLGMRVILDGVYSHTGSNSVYFDREGHFGTGAYSRGEDSPYYKWYTFKKYPDEYDCWWNFPTLPNVSELDPSYMDFIIEGEDSVIAHWLKLGADGFRLDVVDELPDEFVRRFHARLRELKSDALLIGEVWEDASNKTAYDVYRRYFTDRELSSTMNYPWQKGIIAFLKGQDDGSRLGECIMTIAENYPADVLHSMMNLLGTHDTPRILTVLGAEGDGNGEDKEALAAFRLTEAQRKTGLHRLRLASFLEFTLPGSACIYYGDEAGMEGCKDPFSRGCFPWGQEDTALQAHYRALGALKTGNPALQRGDVQVTIAGGGRLSFTRSLDGVTIECYVNLSDEPWITAPGELRFGILAEQSADRVIVDPNGCAAVIRK